jgi:hypothetical protein
MEGTISFTHAFNKYICCSPFCSLILLMCEMSAGIPCIPLTIPEKIEQSEQTAAQLRFLVPLSPSQE